MEHSAWNVEGAYTPGGSAEIRESARLLVFRRPEIAMRDIVARPSFIVPLTLCAFAAAAYTAVAIPAAFRAAGAIPTWMAATAMGMVVRLLVMTGFLAVIVATLAETPVNFRQLFAVVTYSRMPGVAFTVLAILLILLRRASGLDDGHPYNPLITNVAYFLDPAAHSRLVYSMASSVDCVNFWELSLIAVGLKATARMSSTAVSASVVTLWAVYSVSLAAWMQWGVR